MDFTCSSVYMGLKPTMFSPYLLLFVLSLTPCPVGLKIVNLREINVPLKW